MAQRSITSFFGVKSPPQPSTSTTTSGEKKSSDAEVKKVLSSPSNRLTSSPSKPVSIEKAKTQLILQASPQKKLVAASPQKKEKEVKPKEKVNKKKKVVESDESDSSRLSSPKSASSEDSENSVPEKKVVRKRRRLSSTSSSSSASSNPANSSHASLSTDYNDVEMMEVKEKKPEQAKKDTKKGKSPASKLAAKKKTPAKTAKVEEKTPKPTAEKAEGAKKKTPKSAEKKKTPSKLAKAEEKTPKAIEKVGEENPTEVMDLVKTNPKEELKPIPAKSGEYDPMQEKYDPVTSATWKYGEKTPFLGFARTLDCAEKTSSRLRTMETVANFFSSVIRLSPADLPSTVYLCLGIVAPAHLGIETSVGEGVLLKAMEKATGRQLSKIKEDLQKKGDIGEVAETSRLVQPKLGFALAKPAALTVSGVFAKLREIAAMHGNSSQNQRVDTIARLLSTCQPVEAKFLVRLLIGKLRVGLAEQSVLIALAHSAIYAKCKTQKERTKYCEDKQILDKVAKSLRLAFAHCPDVDRITTALKLAVESESDDLIAPLLDLPKLCPIVPGLPVKPMLAQPAKSLHEIVEKLGEQAKNELEGLPGDDSEKPGRTFACEYKYDGERAQIHVFYDKDKKPTVKIYSRNQEDHTVRFSEVANRIANEAVLPEAVGKSLIIDSEIVAVDSNGRHLPFQMLAARKRKETTLEDEKKAKKAAEDKEKVEEKVPAYRAIAFVFDCIFIGGESMVGDTLLERRRKIRECIKPIEGLVEWAVSFEIDIDKQEHEVEEKVGHWLNESVKDGCEGLIVKTATSKYMVARRAPCWLKLKKDYIETEVGAANGMGGDSVDLVVVGGYWGAGKRTGRLGAFLLGSYDHLDDQYETVCKLGTGLSDELLDQLTEQLMPSARPQGAPAPSYVKRSQGLPEPDVWLEPSVVWEIRAADLSLSNIHTSGLGTIPSAPDRGVSLRFPRYVRPRPDKKPEEATTSENMCRRYANQQQVQHAADGKSKATAVDDDFY